MNAYKICVLYKHELNAEIIDVDTNDLLAELNADVIDVVESFNVVNATHKAESSDDVLKESNAAEIIDVEENSGAEYMSPDLSVSDDVDPPFMVKSL